MSTHTTAGIGLFYDMPASAYHVDPAPEPSLSSGAARTLLSKSPAHAAMEHPRLGGVRRESTAAMGTGTLIHAILSGDTDQITLSPYDDYKTKAAREWRDAEIESGRIVVKHELLAMAKTVADQVRKLAPIGITNTPFTDTAKHEVAAIWKESGCYCRALFDVLNVTDHGADIWDWKTTNDISDRGIEKAVAKYRYDIQAAFYLRGLETLMPAYRGRTSFIFVFVESEAPHTVRRVCLQPSYLQHANAKVAEAIDTWSRCLANNDFPLMPPDTLALELPAWLDDSEDEITVS
jgi:hypothetical protein